MYDVLLMDAYDVDRGTLSEDIIYRVYRTRLTSFPSLPYLVLAPLDFTLSLCYDCRPWSVIDNVSRGI